LEFDTVFLPNLSKDDLPNIEDVELYGDDEARSNDGRLLYVGVTRARANLILTHSGERTSMLPGDENLYTSKVIE
jgi:superfamily I DNA/RNA helicase